MEGGCIPWSKAFYYAKEYQELDGELTEIFLYIISELDTTFLTEMRKKQEKA